MRSWKKMWKDELDALPPIGRQVLDAPSPAVCDEVTVNADGSLTRKKKILAFTLPPALVAVVLAVVLVCVFLLPVRDAVQRYAFMLEINPSVTVVTDADGTVTSVAATNADADIVLADGVAESMLGKPVGDALVIFADRAAMLGFIDTEGESAVRLTSCGDGGELLSDARETLETHFMEDGIYALVLSAERTVSDFAALCGAAASDTVSAVADFVENVSVFFRNRGVEDMTADELADAYENTVFDDAFVETAKDYLSYNLARIEKNAADVGNLYTLYFDILSHDDNPALVWKERGGGPHLPHRGEAGIRHSHAVGRSARAQSRPHQLPPLGGGARRRPLRRTDATPEGSLRIHRQGGGSGKRRGGETCGRLPRDIQRRARRPLPRGLRELAGRRALLLPKRG